MMYLPLNGADSQPLSVGFRGEGIWGLPSSYGLACGKHKQTALRSPQTALAVVAIEPSYDHPPPRKLNSTF